MNLFDILPTDAKFYYSSDAGDPACICSRCLLPIGEDDVPIRAWSKNGDYEYRYHSRCAEAAA